MSANKVFVSPGVYTSEVDLSFVAQSVGVTTLGIVGETLKGPAFEPIFIRNYDEFTTYFGGTSPEKFINTQIPKYEAAYIAKAYLQQSNQLFVTRVLGLSGYDAGPSWSIKTVANVDPATVEFDCVNTETLSCQTQCIEYNVSSYTINFTGCTSGSDSIQFTSAIPDLLSGDFTLPYEKFNGNTSTIKSDLQTQIYNIFVSPSTSATSINYFGTISGGTYDVLSATYTSENNVFGVDNVSSDLANYSAPINDPWYYATFDNNGNGQYSGYSFYSIINSLSATTTVTSCATFFSYSVSAATIGEIVGDINYNTNTISICLPSGSTTADTTAMTITYSACSKTSGVTSESVVQSAITVDYNFSSLTKNYTIVSSDDSTTTNWTVNLLLFDPCGVCLSGNTGTANPGVTTTCYTGSVSGTVFIYDGKSYTDFDDMVIATFRSRGLATYSSDDGAVYEVSGLTDVSMDCSGTYSAVTKNPFATFKINLTNKDGVPYQFETSFSPSDTRFLTKVFGTTNFGKSRTDVPIFVEEQFLNLLTWSYRKGYIRGLNCQMISLPNARQAVDTTSIAWYLEKYQSPISPWVVSELRGNKVFELFKFMTIADGDAANSEVKISIRNISFNNGIFDVLVRDFFDTDSNPVVLESFTNCSMDPRENNYIGKKIGTSDGEYQINSKFIMVEVNPDAPTDALPCGFEGYTYRQYSGAKPPFPIYKTKYDFPGELVYNPPFGSSSGADDAVTSNGDKIARTYLGISDSIGIDIDFYEYKGKQLPNNPCLTVAPEWGYRTKGFHMDKNASGITIPSTFATSGTPAYFVGSAEFTSDPQSESNPYYRINARKFTLLCAGGFDGWDIYRESRTNGDRFVLGKSGFLAGALSVCSTKYPLATGWGAFKEITVGDNSADWANTDYYAYLLGQKTFENPEAVNINVFVTPGIDLINNNNLAEAAIEMIEFNRADSIYIATSPDFNMFVPTNTDTQDLIYPQQIVDSIDDLGYDSNYTATYYPWVLTRDTVNNTQIYIPPTAEVCKNLALTDNIAFPWFAAAGYTRGIVSSIKARKKLTQEDRDVLYGGRINPIATFADVGTVIWGNKTMQVKESALDRINVRRLLLQARKLISAVSVRLLFEQNDEKVRQDFLNAVNPILDSIRRDRGLYDFRVTVSSDPADLDRNQLTGKIYIKPTKALEFIDITFYITPTGASFENI